MLIGYIFSLLLMILKFSLEVYFLRFRSDLGQFGGLATVDYYPQGLVAVPKQKVRYFAGIG
jgi:hypothetical protein